MKTLFIQYEAAIKSYGVMILSACLKKHGFETDLLIEALEKDLLKKICDINPDIIAFSVSAADHDWLLETIKKIKTKINKIIIVGGPLPTFYPDIIKEEFIDIICIGEGEFPIVELLEKLKKGEDITNIRNLWVKKNGKIFKNPVRELIDNLDSLPFADRSIYEKYPFFKLVNYDTFLAGIGCTGRCTFCFNVKYHEIYANKGKIIRRRSVDHLISEIKQVKEQNKKLKQIIFIDSNFLLCSKDWLDEFVEKYKNVINIPFVCGTRADFVNEDSISKLKSAGCFGIRIGIESANTFLREIVMKKGLTNKQIIDACDIIKKHKINLQTFNIMGAPGETLDTALESYELSWRIHPQHAWCSLISFYPGTEILKIAQEQNLIKNGDDFKNINRSYFSSLPYEHRHKKEIINLQRLFQFGNVFRIPPKIMAYLIKLPQNHLYKIIFKINYALEVKNWMPHISWRLMFKMSRISKYA